MNVGRVKAVTKTEVICFPLPRVAYEAADSSRFYVDGSSNSTELPFLLSASVTKKTNGFPRFCQVRL